MSDNNNPIEIYPAKVVNVISDEKIVINRGIKHRVQQGQRFLIYRLSEEDIIDPDTKLSLGKLEYVIGKGKVIHVQESIATIEADEKTNNVTRKIIKTKQSHPLLSTWGGSSQEEEIIPQSEIKPFEDPRVGDLAKPI